MAAVELNRPSPKPEVIFSGVLAEIVNDVVEASRLTPNNPDHSLFLVEQFKKHLVENAEEARSNFAQASKALSIIDGEEFTSLPPAEQRKRVYKLSEEEYFGRQKTSKRLLEELYEKYREASPGEESSIAWQNFINVFKIFNGRVDRLFHIKQVVVIFPTVFAETRVELPSFTRRRDLPTYTKDTNFLQMRYARQLGVLEGDETFVDFMHRDGITIVKPDDWRELRRIKKEEPGTIVGMQGGIWRRLGQMEILHGGLPTLYESVPTKYRGITTTIKFFVKETADKHVDLDTLLAQNEATPVMGVVVPTDLFFSS